MFRPWRDSGRCWWLSVPALPCRAFLFRPFGTVARLSSPELWHVPSLAGLRPLLVVRPGTAVPGYPISSLRDCGIFRPFETLASALQVSDTTELSPKSHLRNQHAVGWTCERRTVGEDVIPASYETQCRQARHEIARHGSAGRARKIEGVPQGRHGSSALPCFFRRDRQRELFRPPQDCDLGLRACRKIAQDPVQVVDTAHIFAGERDDDVAFA